MPLVAVLNDLSLVNGPTTRDAGREAMSNLVTLLRRLRQLSGDVALQTPSPLKTIQIAENFSVPMWLGDDDVRDQWRFLLTLQNRSPYEVGFESLVETSLGIDYHVDGQSAKGLGWAHLCGGLGISLQIDPQWNVDWLTLSRETVRETDDDNLVLETDAVDVRHASTIAHTSSHEAWLAGLVEPIKRGSDLWARREELFPSLRFLPRVQKQLEALAAGTEHLHAISERLRELSDTIAGWNPANGEHPEWRSKITGEHEGRRNLCYFTNEQQVSECYDLHARFTPGAGRIYFRLVASERTAVIAHVGEKLV